MKRVLGISIAIIATLPALPLLSRAVWHRSLQASLVEFESRRRNTGVFDTAEAAEAHIAELASLPETPYALPAESYACPTRIEERRGIQTIVVEGAQEAERIVVFLHGGAYVGRISPRNVSFCDRLAKASGSMLVAPLYPLAPHHTWQDAYEPLDALFDDLQEAGKPIIVIGSSAGGGLAAGFAMYRAKEGKPGPARLILFSPWVDASLSGDYAPFEKADPLLGADGLRRIARAWAGDLPLEDWRLSPIFGDVAALPPTMLFAGTREIFYPDVAAFHDRLLANGVASEFIVGNGLNHVWPLSATPEAEDAFPRIVSAVRVAG